MHKLYKEDLDPLDFKLACLVADGLTNPQIGLALCLPEGAVRGRLSRLLKEHGLKSRHELGAALGQSKMQRFENIFVGGLLQLPVGAQNAVF